MDEEKEEIKKRTKVIWEKIPDKVLDRPIKKEYFKFMDLASRKFIKDFKYNFPAYVTPKKKVPKWLIAESRLGYLRNIFIKAVEDAIKEENFKLLEGQQEDTIKRLKELIREAKEDLDYINNKVLEKVKEEERFG